MLYEITRQANYDFIGNSKLCKILYFGKVLKDSKVALLKIKY